MSKREFSKVDDWLSMGSKPRDMGGTCTCDSQTCSFLYCILLADFIIVWYVGSVKQCGGWGGGNGIAGTS